MELSGYSLNIQNTFTASINEGFIWVGNSNNKTHLISTASLLITSSFNEYTASISTASLVDRLSIIENVTSSYETKGNGIISSSTQISEQGFVSSSTVNTIVTMTSASYAEITPVSGTLYIIIG
jgi:phage terminase large subunit-like protein